MFRRSNRSRGNLAQTLRDQNPKAFKNNLLSFLWLAFPGMVLWVIWKEQNNKIFRERERSLEASWKTICSNLLETIRSMQWSDEDKEFIGWEKSVAEAWGLDKGVISDLPWKPKVCKVESPLS